MALSTMSRCRLAQAVEKIEQALLLLLHLLLAAQGGMQLRPQGAVTQVECNPAGGQQQ
jgi:hypothetical protein